MQAQSQRIVSQSMPVTGRGMCVRALPASGHAFSSHSNSFTKGLAVRSGRRVSNQTRRSNLHVSADFFYTQKTVPDQTGRVAIVTGLYS